jgi:hypothetical protein
MKTLTNCHIIIDEEDFGKTWGFTGGKDITGEPPDRYLWMQPSNRKLSFKPGRRAWKEQSE